MMSEISRWIPYLCGFPKVACFAGLVCALCCAVFRDMFRRWPKVHVVLPESEGIFIIH